MDLQIKDIAIYGIIGLGSAVAVSYLAVLGEQYLARIRQNKLTKGDLTTLLERLIEEENRRLKSIKTFTISLQTYYKQIDGLIQQIHSELNKSSQIPNESGTYN